MRRREKPGRYSKYLPDRSDDSFRQAYDCCDILSDGEVTGCSRRRTLATQPIPDDVARYWRNGTKKRRPVRTVPFGTPSGARTLDTLIKSQVLYQLS